MLEVQLHAFNMPNITSKIQVNCSTNLAPNGHAGQMKFGIYTDTDTMLLTNQSGYTIVPPLPELPLSEHYTVPILSDALNQGACGSCYAFSAAGMLTDRINLAGLPGLGKRNEFPQEGCEKCTGPVKGCNEWCRSHQGSRFGWCANPNATTAGECCACSSRGLGNNVISPGPMIACNTNPKLWIPSKSKLSDIATTWVKDIGENSKGMGGCNGGVPVLMMEYMKTVGVSTCNQSTACTTGCAPYGVHVPSSGGAGDAAPINPLYDSKSACLSGAQRGVQNTRRGAWRVRYAGKGKRSRSSTRCEDGAGVALHYNFKFTCRVKCHDTDESGLCQNYNYGKCQDSGSDAEHYHALHPRCFNITGLPFGSTSSFNISNETDDAIRLEIRNHGPLSAVMGMYQGSFSHAYEVMQIMSFGHLPAPTPTPFPSTPTPDSQIKRDRNRTESKHDGNLTSPSPTASKFTISASPNLTSTPPPTPIPHNGITHPWSNVTPPVPVSSPALPPSPRFFGKVYAHHGPHAELVGYHAIVIVGWGEENGVKYWLVRNSWGSKFPDQGYFRILRGVNFCGIESQLCFASPGGKVATKRRSVGVHQITNIRNTSAIAGRAHPLDAKSRSITVTAAVEYLQAELQQNWDSYGLEDWHSYTFEPTDVHHQVVAGHNLHMTLQAQHRRAGESHYIDAVVHCTLGGNFNFEYLGHPRSKRRKSHSVDGPSVDDSSRASAAAAGIQAIPQGAAESSDKVHVPTWALWLTGAFVTMLIIVIIGLLYERSTKRQRPAPGAAIELNEVANLRTRAPSLEAIDVMDEGSAVAQGTSGDDKNVVTSPRTPTKSTTIRTRNVSQEGVICLD